MCSLNVCHFLNVRLLTSYSLHVLRAVLSCAQNYLVFLSRSLPTLRKRSHLCGQSNIAIDLPFWYRTSDGRMVIVQLVWQIFVPISRNLELNKTKGLLLSMIPLIYRKEHNTARVSLRTGNHEHWISEALKFGCHSFVVRLRSSWITTTATAISLWNLFICDI